ncbi:MAG: hypothetical protein PHH69_00210 [Candidatus Omnitrophica bacterium]|nr:hypothetical protein [Candidatus Omnitrophota bacterium]
MKKNIIIYLIPLLILVYTVINVFAIMHHEPWRDEAQAWLLARDANLFSLFKSMHYEATPALWHLLIMPFAKAGLPFITQFIIHLFIAIAAVTLFLYYAPFPNLTKLLFIFSYYLAYEYSVIARNYSISILLLFLIAILYPKRFKLPIIYSLLIFLLSNTNALSIFPAFALIIIFILEFHKYAVRDKKTYLSILIMLLGSVLAILQIYPYKDSWYLFNFDLFYKTNYLEPFYAIARTFIPFAPSSLFYISLASIILIIMALPILTEAMAFSILALSYTGLFYVLIFHSAERWHAGFLLIILIFSLWIATYYSNHVKEKTDKRLLKSLFIKDYTRLSLFFLNICLILSVIFTIKAYLLEYKYCFSGARDMAEFIQKNDLDDSIIIAQNSPSASALLPYLPHAKFWYAGEKEFGTYVIFSLQNRLSHPLSAFETISRAKEKFPNKGKKIFLLITGLDPTEGKKFRLLYKTDKSKNNPLGAEDESFYLYQYID